MTDKLTEIMLWKRQEVAQRARRVDDAELARWGERRRQAGARSLARALRRPGGLAVIAEVKRRSPSAGDIAATVKAEEQARRYYNAGADALSILTDEKYFGGTLQDLWEVADLLNHRADAPALLRKDFTVHPWQILEAAEAGAAAILLIVRALPEAELRELFRCATLAGLDALFEVHEASEIDRALAAGATIIGVNNRDLARMQTDLSASEELLPRIPTTCVRISESGIATLADAERVRAVGADAVLVGEALMRAEDPAELIEGFRAVA